VFLGGNRNELVPIKAELFMLESEGMQRFVHGNARLIPTHE
jgi:hypothetical protein